MLYLPLLLFSCDVLACIIHCILEGNLTLWTMVQNLPPPGSEKLLSGVEVRGGKGRKRDIIKKKRHHSWMGVKPGSDCTGNGGMPQCCMWSHILASALPPDPFLPLAPIFSAGFLKSHIYAGVHFSTQDQPEEVLFYCILYGHVIERTSTPECVS